MYMVVALYFAVLYFYRSQTKLREGNVFTPVCHSVHRERGSTHPTDADPPIECRPPGGRPPYADVPPSRYTWDSTGYSQQAGGTHPIRMHTCYRPQTKFAKVMFLHLSVSHSVHRGWGCIPACN